MHPILGRLTNEVLLTASCRAIPLDWVAPRPNLVVELRELDDEFVVVVVEERFCPESGGEDGFEVPRREFLEIFQPLALTAVVMPLGSSTDIVLLDNLLEAGIIELGELGHIMHVGNDVAQIFLEQHKILLGGAIIFGFSSDSIRRRLLRSGVIQARQHIADLLFAGLDPAHNLAGFDTLKGENLVELGLEHGDERFLVFLGPWSSAWVRLLCSGLLLVGSLEGILQIVIGDVVVIIVFQQRCFQLLAEAETGSRDQRWVGSRRLEEHLLHDSARTPGWRWDAGGGFGIATDWPESRLECQAGLMWKHTNKKVQQMPPRPLTSKMRH